MLNITRKISSYNFSSRCGNTIQYIVLHYTGNTKDTASGNATYFNLCNRNASAHYFVDDECIYQVVEDSNASWAVGDGKGVYGISNKNSISIEMCCSGNYIISDKTECNTVELVKYLMQKYNIDINHIVRHYDASRKICPNWQDNNWERWSNFKNKLLKAKGEWIKDNTGWWYKHSDGSYTVKDFELIDGKWYYFDYKGYMVTGWLHLTSNNCDYYFYSNGEMAHDCNLYGYSFDSNGHAAKL